MKSIAVINQKGGVGKTTSTANLGAGLARFGKRVLLLDLDPQANLTLHLDCRPEDEGATMTQMLAENQPLKSLVCPTTEAGLSIVPADTSLGGVEQLLANRIGRETILREALEAYAGESDFDYVLMDCPPSLGVLSANALVSADEVLIPMQTEYFSLQGMAKLTEVISLVQRRLNEDLGILFVLPCMVDLRTRLTSEVLSEIERHFGPLVAETRIRPNVKLAEAPSFGLTIFQHAPASNGAQDYESLAREVLERHGVKDIPEFQSTVLEDAETEEEELEAEQASPEPSPAEPAVEVEVIYPLVEAETPKVAKPSVGDSSQQPEVVQPIAESMPTQGPPAPQIPHVSSPHTPPVMSPSSPPPAPMKQRIPPTEQSAEMD